MYPGNAAPPRRLVGAAGAANSFQFFTASDGGSGLQVPDWTSFNGPCYCYVNTAAFNFQLYMIYRTALGNSEIAAVINGTAAQTLYGVSFNHPFVNVNWAYVPGSAVGTNSIFMQVVPAGGT